MKDVKRHYEITTFFPLTLISTICDYIYNRFMPAESHQFDVSSGSTWKREHGHVYCCQFGVRKPSEQ
jgi:hypothetical protein